MPPEIAAPRDGLPPYHEEVLRYREHVQRVERAREEAAVRASIDARQAFDRDYYTVTDDLGYDHVVPRILPPGKSVKDYTGDA